MATAKLADKRRFATVVELVSANGAAFRTTARRYSLCTADADDAYQRGLEILLTKAPNDEPAQLRPWLHTVIKHEALAIRRQRERLLSDAGAMDAGVAGAASPEEEASERQRAVRTAEALGQLKSSELRCMLLKALGYSYDEIAERTGFSWTKVNRSLTEGRKHFFNRFAQIESGERCDAFRPLVSAACDGEASTEDEQTLVKHLRGCQSCRAAVRAYRAAPARLAELLPPGLVAPLLSQRSGWWQRLLETVVGGTGDRAGAIGYKIQQTGELLSAQKATAVVASTAVLAGGAVQGHRARHHHHQPAHSAATLSGDTNEADRAPAAVPNPSAQPEPERASVVGADETTVEQPAAEFTPEAEAEAVPSAQSATSEFAQPAASSSTRRSSGASSEFGP